MRVDLGPEAATPGRVERFGPRQIQPLEPVTILSQRDSSHSPPTGRSASAAGGSGGAAWQADKMIRLGRLSERRRATFQSSSGTLASTRSSTAGCSGWVNSQVKR